MRINIRVNPSPFAVFLFALIVALTLTLCLKIAVTFEALSELSDISISLGVVVSSFSIAAITLFGALSTTQIPEKLRANDFSADQSLIKNLFRTLKSPLHWGVASVILGFCFKLAVLITPKGLNPSCCPYLCAIAFALLAAVIFACMCAVLRVGRVVTNAVVSQYRSK